ncbi:MAG: hypothetical protein ABI859_20730 [Pseudomonadota bacterium]
MSRIYDRLRATWVKKGYRPETIAHCAPTRASAPMCPACYEKGRDGQLLILLYAGTSYTCTTCKQEYPI